LYLKHKDTISVKNRKMSLAFIVNLKHESY